MTEDQGPVGLKHESSHADDNPILDQEDEFDFTIGGDEDLDPNAGDYNTHDGLADDANETERGGETSFNYEVEEQSNPADDVLALEVGDLYNEDERDEMLEFNVDTAETTDTTNEGHGSNEFEQNGIVSKLEALAPDYTEDHAEGIVEEEVYYQETDNELETFDNSAQPQTDLGSDYMAESTSVDNVSGNEEIHNPNLETTAHEAQVSNSQNAIVEDEKIKMSEALASDDAAAFGFETNEPAEGEVREEQAQYVGGEFGGGEPNYDGDDQEQLSPQKDSMADVLDEAQDHESWDEEEHDDEDSDTRPKVTISYQSQIYSLFAESSDQDPDLYFLADLDSLDQPLSQLLSNIRDVISDEIAPSQEVFLRVNGLGFEFAESTTKDFLDQTTFTQIIELNKHLVANEGGSPSAILHCYLGLRPSCTRRFSELSKAADEGKGLSDIAMFYDDASVDESAEENEEHDFSQDMISESVSLDEAAVGDEETAGEKGGVNDTEQYYNPFRTIEEQFPAMDDVNIPNAAESEFAEQDELTDGALGVESTEFEDANVFENGSGEIDDGFEATTADALDEARDPSGHEEGAYDESAAEDVEVVDVEQYTGVRTELSNDDDGKINGEPSFLSPSSTCSVEDLCLCLFCLRPEMDVSWSLVSLPDPYTPVPAGAHTDDGAPHFLNVTVSFAEQGGEEAGCVELPRKDFKADINDQENVVNPGDDKDDNDDDYLDLGNNEGEDGTNERPMDSAIEFDEEVAKFSAPAGASPQISHHSSATATLDGNDTGPENIAPLNQESLNSRVSPNEAGSDVSIGEEDEIDWNHEDDGDLDKAIQNPTALSPSSPSAKRYREEDENADGTGDESGEYIHPTCTRMHANKLPAIKRRRT